MSSEEVIPTFDACACSWPQVYMTSCPGKADVRVAHYFLLPKFHGAHLGRSCLSGTLHAKWSRGYRTTTQDLRCRGGQTTCVKCGRRSARGHVYAHPKGL